MKSLILVAALSLAGKASAKEVGCEQIDQSKKYPDGIPYCPEIIKTNTAFAVTRCAFDQAKAWHPAREGEKKDMNELVQGLKDGDAKAILENADSLRLQVCRSEKDGDKFLLMYTKPGVKDYSGPFLMYREGNQTSGVVIQAPHDGQDGTNRSTRAAFQDSNALALISNGHKRTLSGRKKTMYGSAFPSDWAHTKTDLGYTAFLAFKNKFPESVHLHIHGLAANRIMATDSVGWKSAHTLRGAFIAASKKALIGREGFDVVAWRFNGWVTGLAMTMNEGGKGRKDNERWVGAEISVRLHANTNVVTKIVTNLEADYLKKPRAVSVDLDKEVVPMEGDTVDPKEMEQGNEPESPDEEVQPMTDESLTPLEKEVLEDMGEQEKIAKLPRKKPVLGLKKLACVGISYTQPINDFVTAARCKDGAKNVAEFYQSMSRGKVKFDVAGYHMDYPGDAWKTFEAAAQLAKKKFKADYYIVPSIFRKGGNHASGGICWVIQMTGWVWKHELGHLLGLGHTGKYVYDKQGKPKLEPYNDKDSVMGNSGFAGLTAPQFYTKDWLRADEVQLAPALGGTFELRKIMNLKGKGLATVVVVGRNARPLFLSFPPKCKGACVALHLSSGGGSQRIAITQDEFYDDDFTGAHVKVLPGAAAGKVRFSLDFEKKPTAFKNTMLAPDEADKAEEAFVGEMEIDESAEALKPEEPVKP